MNVLIVEDEKLVADNLQSLLYKIDNTINVVEKIGTIRDTINRLQNIEVDLIFLDIHLSDGLCFKIFEKIEVLTPVIFITAYDQYAVKAFKLNSVDYILKPVDIEKLTQSINKYKRLFKTKKHEEFNFASLIESIENNQHKYKKRFVTSVGNKIKVFDVDDIAYFYIFEKNVFLKTKDDINSALDYSLNELETLLSPDKFLRINRKYIISISSIKSMYRIAKSRIKIELTPEVQEDIYISHKRSNEFKNWLNN
ncbi:MAG: LytTR family DNA-binding domain-containing protein [Bacteroidales bacterium]|nr:LytTR family DNA-binding domain-containing protein [Bacteroidales bacterium]